MCLIRLKIHFAIFKMTCAYLLRQMRLHCSLYLKKSKYYLYYTKNSIFTCNESISIIKPLVSSNLSCQIKKMCCYLAEEIY